MYASEVPESGVEKGMAKKILIVEDNELNLKLFRDILEAHDLEVIETRDGTVAIDLAIHHKPELIIMDIQLPEISGVDIIKQMKENETIAYIPIIAVTAFAMKDDEERIMASGCQAYISKPIAIETFVETIQKYLNLAGQE